MELPDDADIANLVALHLSDLNAEVVVDSGAKAFVVNNRARLLKP